MNTEEKVQDNKEGRRKAHGRAIEAYLGFLGFSHEALAVSMGLTSRQVQYQLKKDVIEPKLLKRFAEALQVPVQLIENYDPKDPINIFKQDNKTEHKNELHDSSIQNEEIHQDQYPTYYEKESISVWKQLLTEKDVEIKDLNQQLTEAKIKNAILEKEIALLKK